MRGVLSTILILGAVGCVETPRDELAEPGRVAGGKADNPAADAASSTDAAATPDASAPAPDAAVACVPHTGDPVIDPAPYASCCDGARCVPSDVLDRMSAPDALRARLGACTDPALRCVPEPFLTSGGQFTAASCDSIAGAEGRCLSACLPEVARKKGLLPQGACAPKKTTWHFRGVSPTAGRCNGGRPDDRFEVDAQNTCGTYQPTAKEISRRTFNGCATVKV